MNLNLAVEFEPGKPPEIFAQNLLFYFELMLVTGMLILAPPATAKMWAGRRDAVHRRLDDFAGLRPHKAGLFFGERGFDFLAGKNKRNKHGLAASAVIGGKASESVATIDQLFNVEEQDLILRHGDGEIRNILISRPQYEEL